MRGAASSEPPRLATLVLAAGAGRRFGGAKQVVEVDGRPCLTRVLEAVGGFADRDLVVLGAAAARVRRVVPDGWSVVSCPDWEAGVGASLRTGLRAAGPAGAALIVLGDLPWLRREAVERLLAAAAAHPTAAAIRAFEGDVPGHPLLLRGRLLEEARSAPDAGFGPVLRGVEVIGVDCTGMGVSRDLDSPADLSPTLRAAPRPRPAARPPRAGRAGRRRRTGRGSVAGRRPARAGRGRGSRARRRA